MLVGMESVNEPFESSMRAESLPPPILILIAERSLRANEKSAEPSSPTSTSTRVWSPAFSRSATVLARWLPLTWSVPWSISARTPWAVYCFAPAAAGTTSAATAKTMAVAMSWNGHLGRELLFMGETSGVGVVMGEVRSRCLYSP
jgi:hypothetical protein